MSKEVEANQEEGTEEVVTKKAKPYTAAEVKTLAKDGHVIGNPKNQLSTGHDESGLKKWDKWQLELKLKLENIGGKEVSVPYEAYAVKRISENHIGSNETYQAMNKQVDFRINASPNYHLYYMPAGAVKAGDKIECGYWVEAIGKGISETKHVRALFKGIEDATGAPTTK